MNCKASWKVLDGFLTKLRIFRLFFVNLEIKPKNSQSKNNTTEQNEIKYFFW